MIFTVGGASHVQVGQSVVWHEDAKPQPVVRIEELAGYVWLTLEQDITLVKKLDDLVLVIVVADNEHFYTLYDMEVDDRERQWFKDEEKSVPYDYEEYEMD